MKKAHSSTRVVHNEYLKKEAKNKGHKNTPSFNNVSTNIWSPPKAYRLCLCTGPFLSWYGSFIRKKRKKDRKVAPLYLFWSTWKERNRKMFENIERADQPIKHFLNVHGGLHWLVELQIRRGSCFLFLSPLCRPFGAFI